MLTSLIEKKMSYIIIKFESCPGEIRFDHKYLSEYPYSLITGYTEVFPESNTMTLDVDYDDFETIYQVVRGKKDLWSLPKNLFELAHKMGLSNDTMCEIDDILLDTYHRRRETVEKFLATPGDMLMSNTIDEYLKMEQIFTRNANIVPFQVVTRDDFIKVINIYDGIPIWVAGSVYSCDAKDRKCVDGIDAKTNINDVRHNMLPISSNTPEPDIFSTNLSVYLETLMEFVVGQFFYEEFANTCGTNYVTIPTTRVLSGELCEQIICIFLKKSERFCCTVGMSDGKQLMHIEVVGSDLYPADHNVFRTHFGFVNIR